MRAIYKIIMALLMATNVNALETVKSAIGETDISGHVTVGGYFTTRNNFEAGDTTDGYDLNEIGVLLYHTFNNNFSATLYSTSDFFVDYGFLQGRYTWLDTTIGLRVGRINVSSGLFGGYGPHSDGMNFLPQGTSPSRVGRAFFRFDGVQGYYEQMFKDGSGLILEASYGEHVTDSVQGVYEPAFFAIFDGSTLTANFSRPAFLLNVNYYVGNLEFIVNYSDMLGNLSGHYSNTIPLEFLTGDPADVGQFVEIDEDIQSDDYPSKLLKVGVAYAVGNFEHAFTYFRWVDTPEPTYIGSSSLGDLYVSDGISYILRYAFNYDTIAYTGYTEYTSTFGNEQINIALKSAPDWVDRGQSIMLGVKYQVSDSLQVIAESHFNKGGIYLSGEFQDPVTAVEYWNLHSITASFLF